MSGNYKNKKLKLKNLQQIAQHIFCIDAICCKEKWTRQAAKISKCIGYLKIATVLLLAFFSTIFNGFFCLSPSLLVSAMCLSLSWHSFSSLVFLACSELSNPLGPFKGSKEFSTPLSSARISSSYALLFSADCFCFFLWLGLNGLFLLLFCRDLCAMLSVVLSAK